MKRPFVVLIVWSVCLVIIAVAAGYLLDDGIELRDLILGAGVWGPVVLILLQASRPVTWIPGPLLTPTAGFVYGFGHGLLISWTGMILAVLVGYATPRLIGKERCRELVRRFASPLARLEGKKRSGFAVLAARVVPGVPANVVSYAAGGAGLPLVPYLIASAVGILPRLILQTLVGTGLYALSAGG